MQKRILGKTGLAISVIGFGGIPIQRFNQTLANEVLETCIAEGITFIDSARGYGQSERLIGQAIKGQRDLFVLASKSPAKDKATMADDIAISLDAFQTDYIDLYQCHFVKDMDQYHMITGPGGAYEALMEAKVSGKIKHIGITAHNKDILAHAIETGLWDTIQFPYNFVETQGLEVFKRAHELGIGIIIMKPLAGGAISDVDLSLRFILDNPHVSVAIPGMESKSQVLQNAQVGHRHKPLSQAEIDHIQHIRDTLGNQFCRRCGYCGPCPQHIDIPLMFILRGYVERYDLEEWAKTRYQSLSKTASDCIKCGVCEPRCPYDLKIRDMMDEVVSCFKA